VGQYSPVGEDLETVVDEDLRSEAAWDRFSNSPNPRARDGVAPVVVLDVLAAALACAAALVVVAAVVEAFGSYGASLRDRAFIGSSDGASVVTAFLALAAIGVEFALGTAWTRRLGRFTLACGSVVSAVVVAGVAFRIGWLGLVHPNISASDFASVAELRAVQATGTWPVRVQAMLQAVAAGLLSGAALYVARRASARPATSEEPPRS
jgi:hypothetical protein